MYDNLEYASRRLIKTVVKTVTGKPIFVYNVTQEKGEIEVVSEIGEVFLLKNIDLTPVELGYVNIEHSAFYTMRKPVRGVWRQGLCNNNMVCIRFDGQIRNIPVPCEELYNCIKGIYPRFEDVVNKVQRKDYTVGFSRSFAMNNSTLFYKGKTVGLINRGIPVLNPQYNYLEPRLNEVI
jgi:hypothetical protein